MVILKEDMSEIWKEILGTDGWYFASTEGRIMRKGGRMPGRKHGFKNDTVLKQTPTADGYLQVGIFGKMKYVHALVLETFVGPRPEKLQVRHLDDIAANNRLSNLCYGTPSENAQDVSRLGNRAARSAERAAEIMARLRGKSKWTHKEMGELAGEFGVCAKTVREIWKGETWAGAL